MLPDTSRRALLRGLTAAPVAIAAASVPLAVLAASGAPAAGPDAELIRRAGRVADLARRAQRMADRYAELVERSEALLGKPMDAAMAAKIDAACTLCGRHDARLQRWSRDLALIPAATPAGMGAKASACMVVRNSGWSVPVDWLDELAASVLHDAARIGGVV